MCNLFSEYKLSCVLNKDDVIITHCFPICSFSGCLIPVIFGIIYNYFSCSICTCGSIRCRYGFHLDRLSFRRITERIQRSGIIIRKAKPLVSIGSYLCCTLGVCIGRHLCLSIIITMFLQIFIRKVLLNGICCVCLIIFECQL